MFGTYWSPEEDRILREEWMRGTLTKRISDRTGRSHDAVKGRIGYLRKRGDPAFIERRDEFTGKVQVLLPTALDAWLSRRAVERGQSRASYVRALIRRDMG